MTSRRILGLASAANEKVIAYRNIIDSDGFPIGVRSTAGLALTEAVDALTSAIAEEANE